MGPSQTRKAVIAIHGVGSPERGSTAAAVVELLSATRSYSVFEELSLQVPLLPPDVVRECDERSEPDQKFAASRIRSFIGNSEHVYSTSVLKGQNQSDGSSVDVFEVYWGDLSHTKSFMRTVWETILLPYRFIFLGEIAWRAMTPIRRCPLWTAAGVLYLIARDLVTIVVPLVLLELLPLGTVAATLSIPAAGSWVASSILALAAVVLSGIGLYRSRWSITALGSALTLLSCGAVAGYVGFRLNHGHLTPYTPQHFLAIEILVGGWALIAWLISLTDVWGERALARWMWRITCGAAIVYYAIKGWQRYYVEALVTWSFLHCIEFACLGAALFFVSAALCVTCALLTFLRVPEQKGELKGTIWTMWLGLSITAAAVLTPIGALPSALQPFASDWLHRHFISSSHGFIDFNDLFEQIELSYLSLIQSGVTIGGVVALTLLLCAGTMALAPSLYSEFRPAPEQSSDAQRSGRWLSNGLKWIALAGVIGGAFIIVFPTCWIFLSFPFAASSTLNQVAEWFGGRFWQLVALLLTSIAFKFSGAVMRVISTVLNLILDVELYLRDTPRGRSARALIHQRFLTLLDYIDRRDYDQIVFIAHSQGTVILLDALRFIRLSTSKHPILSRLDAGSFSESIITMGSPLRQLYASAFPPLFDWSETPELASTGVSTWINLYRSADYVGRQLTRADNAACVYDSASDRCLGIFKEYCIGPGAHTHYWDSPKVARVLNGLLQERNARSDGSQL